MLSKKLGVMRLMHFTFINSYVPQIISGELKLTFYKGNPFLVDPLDNCVYDYKWYESGQEDEEEENLIAVVNALVIKCEMFKWWVDPHDIITHELFKDEVNDFMYAFWEENKSD